MVQNKQCRQKLASELSARSKLTKIDGFDTKLTLTVGNMNFVNSTLESVRLLVNSPANYAARLSRSQDEVQAAQVLRFEVFNLELNEGLEQSYVSGLDEDPFDAVCDHLIVEHLPSQQIVGTYRLQTGANRELIGRSDMNHRAEPRGIVKLRKQSGERLQGREREQKNDAANAEENF